MGFFENATGFTIGTSNNNDIAPGATVTYTINNAAQLLPPSILAAQAAAHIPSQINGPSSAPQLSSVATPPPVPQIASSSSAPAVPTAEDDALTEQTTGALPTKLTPSEGQSVPEKPCPSPASIPSPPPSPKVPARSTSQGPARKKVQAPRSPSPKSSIDHHSSRPYPRPVQPESILTDIDALDVDEDSLPKFRYGIVAAVDAQAHLLHKTKAIGNLLKIYGIDIASWVAQTGFRVDSSEDGHRVGLPPVLRQEIVITISTYQVVKKKLPELAKELKPHVSPYYGTIKFLDSKKTWDLDSQSKEVAERSSSKDILAPQCSRPHESVFDVDVPDPTEAESPPFVKLSIINFANDEDPRNHFTTSTAFTLEKDEKARQGSNPTKIKFSECKFEGPSSYTLQGASVRVTLDQATEFEDVLPEEAFEIDPTAQLKYSSQKTKKQTTKTAGVELAKVPKVVGNVAMTTGLDEMSGVETMRNAWQVWHSADKMSQTIRYSSLRQEFSRRVSFPEKLRPSMKFAPSTRRSPPTTITVRLWSFWSLESLADTNQGGFVERLWSSAFGAKSQREVKKADPRAYANVAYCVEIDLPLDFMGSARETVTREDILDNLAM